MHQGQKLLGHPCGYYLQAVPADPMTGLAAVPYDVAEKLGCFKLDFLHVKIYDYFSSREEIKELLKIEPDWGLLLHPSVVKQLFHLGKHAQLLSQVKPTSVIELADVLSLIRPQKAYLLKYYLQDREQTRPFLYAREPGLEGYAFKKSHAIAYALVIVLQLHLIKGGLDFN